MPASPPSSCAASARRRAFGTLLAASAAILWGTTGTAQTFITGGLPPVWLGALRIAVAALFFAALLGAQRLRRGHAAEAQQTDGVARGSAANVLRLSLLSGLAIGCYNLLFFAGVKAAGIAVGTSLVIGSAPIWAGLIQSLQLRRLPRALWCAGVAAAAAGLAAMAVSQNAASAAPFGLAASTGGFALCLGAGLSYALYAIFSKPLVEASSPLAASAYTFAAALIVTAAAAFAIEGIPRVTPDDALIVLYLGFIVTGAAYLLFTTGLQRISAATGVAATLIEPATAFVLAVTVAGEPFSAAGCFGFLAILAGLTLILKAETNRREEA